MTYAFAHRFDAPRPPSAPSTAIDTLRGDAGGTAGLAALTAVLTVAVFAAPARLAGATPLQRDRLPDAAQQAFASFWSGSTSALDDLAAYWTRFHTVKAAIAGMLLVSAVVLTRRLARRFVARSGGPGLGDVVAGAAVIGSTVLTGLAALLLTANIQGAFVPRSSLLSAVPVDGAPPSDLSAMVDDFGRYHLVMAATAGVTAAALTVLAVSAWRRRARSSTRAVAVSRAYVAALVLGALAAAVITAANVSTAVDPAPALESVFTSV